MRSRVTAAYGNVDLGNSVRLESGAEQHRIGRAALAVQVDHRRLDRRVSHPCLHPHKARAAVDSQASEGVAKVAKPERAKPRSITDSAEAFTDSVAVQLAPRKRGGEDQIIPLGVSGSPGCERPRELRDERH